MDIPWLIAGTAAVAVLAHEIYKGVKRARRGLPIMAVGDDADPAPVAPVVPAPPAPPDPTRPARTTAFDVLDTYSLDPATREFLGVLRDCPTPVNDGEVAMARKLAEHIQRAVGQVGCVRSCPTSGPDIIFRERVAAECKRPINDSFSASEVDRACGQIVKYAGQWNGPLLLVLFARSAPVLDARLRELLAGPSLRGRAGGPVMAVWKWRGGFKVVA